MLLRGCWLAGGAYLAFRLSVGSIRRLSRMAGHNRKLKRELLNVWKGIEVRTELFLQHRGASPCPCQRNDKTPAAVQLFSAARASSGRQHIAEERGGYNDHAQAPAA